MSYQSRALTSNLRHPSIGGSQNTSGQSPLLVTRINEKKAELENLKQLRDLSAGLAEQMHNLEQKLSTLSDGTEGTSQQRPTVLEDTNQRPFSFNSCRRRAVELA